MDRCDCAIRASRWLRLAAVQTRAIREGDYWLLSGTKRWVGYALAADFIEVLARTREPKPGEPRSAGLETFLVVKQPGTFPAGITGHVIDKIGYTASLLAAGTLEYAFQKATV